VTVRPRQAFWLAVCAAAVSLPLFLLLRSPLTPSLLTFTEFAWRFYGALPPTVLWLGLLLILYIMAAVGWLTLALRGFLRAPRRAPPSSTESAGRVAVLTRWVKRRQRGPFSRHYLKQRVSEIAIEKLARVHRVSPPQIKAGLEANALGLPPEINAYLLVGLSPWPTEPLSGWRELAGWVGLSRLAAPPDEGETERVLEFLESL
jgi:hypothetical protein